MDKRVVILSGAGLSAQSGLKTFRDSGGLWEEYDVMEICSIPGFERNRQKVLDFYDKRREQLANVKPNKAHEIIAKIKEKYKENVSVITQNVDDLLERAGCMDVVHVHGFLPEIYCELCGTIKNIGYKSQKGEVCPKCKSELMRHNIVMFGEMAPFYKVLYEKLDELHFAADSLFVCIGSSGEVLNVAGFAGYANKSILNNLEKTKIDKFFTKSYNEPATTALPKIAVDIDEFFE